MKTNAAKVVLMSAILFEGWGLQFVPDGWKAHPFNPANGHKVILSDTDHLWGIAGSREWVWKSFLRGLNPLFMDPYQREILNSKRRSPETPFFT